MPRLKVSLFVEANAKVLEAAKGMAIDAVEIHTGDFARDQLNNSDLKNHLDLFSKAKAICEQAGWGHHAGHGLTAEGLRFLAGHQLFAEYNIGHWIICRAVFDGLGPVVHDLRRIIDENCRA